MRAVPRVLSCCALALLSLAGALAPVCPASAAPGAPAAAAAPKAKCSAFSAPVLERVNPTSGSASLTLNRSQSDKTAAAGFTSVRDTSMVAAPKAGTGLHAVHRLYRTRWGADSFYSLDPAEVTRAVKLGFVDQGVVFYASKVALSCTVPVVSWFKGGIHRLSTTPSDTAALAAAGWKKEFTRFYLGKPKVDPTFSFAVYSDTQQEVGTDKRFRNRAEYLVKNRKALDLRYVTHVGDVVNWDTPDHRQYAVARDALRPLEDAGIPYSLCIGNHDSMATGVGGSARDPKQTRKLARETTTFNAYLNRQSLNLEGAYERGRVDNTYHVFTAGGAGWLVLNLELWPRPGAVAWAQKVVASHPKHNVIIVTHSYLTAGGGIYTNRGYGDTAPSTLATQLVKKYPNVRMVFSGHTGTTAHRVDKGVHGNRIDSFLLNWTSNTTNRTRLVTIDTKAGTLKTWVYAPYTGESYPSRTVNLKKLSWVR